MGKLSAMDYWQKYGRARVQKLCADCDTSYAYFKHLAHRRKRPSVDMAMRMVAASDGELSLMALLPPKTELRRSPN